MSFVVAIDGPAGSGKGTVTKIVGEKLNLMNIDTGAMFRCIALEMLENNIALEDENKIKNLLESISIELKHENGELIVLLNGNDVSSKIRTEEVSKFVSPVSTNLMIREKLLNLQREISKGKNVIMEGRDIGTVVFPDANVKIYLDATAEERARRRVLQNKAMGLKVNYDEVLKEIKIRDERDSTREIAPLRKADDAILIDSTNMSIDEVVQTICDIVKSKQN